VVSDVVVVFILVPTESDPGPIESAVVFVASVEVVEVSALLLQAVKEKENTRSTRKYFIE
jgi:hypothetical protein